MISDVVQREVHVTHAVFLFQNGKQHTTQIYHLNHSQSVQYNSINYMYIVVQQICRTFFILQNQPVYLQTTFLFSLSSTFSNHYSTFCF